MSEQHSLRLLNPLVLITISYRDDIVTATLIGVATDPPIGVRIGVAKMFTDQVEGIGRASGEDRGTEI